jgi:putative membrane protein
MTEGTALPETTCQPEVDSPEPRETATSSARQTGPTRISAAWVGIIIGALVLVLLLVFILQNTASVKVSYFSATGSMPLGIALLLAAIAGMLLTGGVAALRIWQLRHRLARRG